MSTFFERYQNGEREQVWSELLALGSRVRAEPLYSDAYAVARETMMRAKDNIQMLIPRLESIGYKFSELPSGGSCFAETSTYLSPPSNIGETINNFENLAGVLPLSLRAWYEIVGQVSFIGFHPDWLRLYDLELEDYDPLFFYDPICKFTNDDYERFQSTIENGKPFYLEIGSDNYYKAGYAGGQNAYVVLPCKDADGLLYEVQPFVSYLRECFNWGGFWGLKYCEPTKRPMKDIEFLTQDLFPI